MSEERESLRLVAYNYEPEFTEEEMQNMTTKTPVNNEPVTVSLEEWCSCNECEERSTSEECMCCRSSEYVQPSIDELECITEHPQLQLLILNPDVLTVAFIQIMIYKRQPGRAPDNLTNM
jgi:hypothetical protein